MWYATVLIDTDSRAAMSRLLPPRAMRSAISRCCGESGSALMAFTNRRHAGWLRTTCTPTRAWSDSISSLRQ